MVFVGVMLCNSLDMNKKKRGGGITYQNITVVVFAATRT